jgi:hypothetical protein
MIKRILCCTASMLALFSGTASAASLTLMWDASTPASNVAGYTVSIRQGTGATSLVNVGSGTAWTFNNLTNGANYTFSVRAYTAEGVTSAWAPELSAVPTATLTIAGTSSIPTGQSGSWTATATGLDAAPEYRFRRYSPMSGWIVGREYSPNATWSWQPSGADVGQYLIEVSVRNAGSSVAYDAQATTNYVAVGDAPPLVSMPTRIDFDGDGLSDFSVYRPANGGWYGLLSGGGYSTTFARAWGAPGDLPVAGDYDGDGRTDPAVFRPATNMWYVLRSDSNYTGTIARNWGATGDVPVAGDYDGDGRTDVAVFRPSSGGWYILRSASGVGIGFTWGGLGDIPVPADYDGDGKTDIAIYRPSNFTWYVLHSSTGNTTSIGRTWGVPGTRPVVADYDGDRRADIALYRPSTGQWFILNSSSGFTATTVRLWGTGSDLPVALNFTSTGKANLSIFRPSTSTWWVADGPAFGWGAAGDTPLGAK